MRQLTQKLKNGQLEVLEVPAPLFGPGMVLVKNRYSVISPGTEGSTVRAARRSLIGKAKEKPQQVKQVLEALRQKGPIQTYKAVMRRLESYAPLGYSSAGEVIEVGAEVKGFSVGDLVACGGAGYASHAELVAVPANLCVKLHTDADLKKAAYNTLGAIALQGIRQADLRIGESCAVIGLGLIGQLTCLILRAGGIKVIGIDIAPTMVAIASEHCTDLALNREESGLPERLNEFTDGIGVDAVIITAATGSSDPVNFAGRVVRKKGKVVIVGNVPTGFDRGFYYQKELDLRMSCSYGPGRYDVNYEEKGMDYPVGYVRWTENRNMRAFQDLVHTGKINIDYLTTHIFDLEKAPEAYDLILERKEPFLGILIKYDQDGEIERGKKVLLNAGYVSRSPQAINVAFIGAGNYAKSYLLPSIQKENQVVLKGVMTLSGISSRKAAEQYGFEFCTSNEADIFGHKDINTLFVTTRHDSHADYVIKALKTGKNVFVEKPLCIHEAQLKDIRDIYVPLIDHHPSPFLMIGFNRRFSPLAEMLKKRIGEGPMAMIYRVNAGPQPSDSWTQDREIGGGRVIGEVCHFVDFLTFVNGSLPEKVFAAAMQDPAGMEDTVNVNLAFKNGSIGTISYFCNGSKSLLKEYIEIYKAGMTAVLKDFKELEIYGVGGPFKKKLLSQDKGQKEMVKAVIASLREGRSSPIPFEEIYTVTLTTFKIIESIRTKNRLEI